MKILEKAKVVAIVFYVCAALFLIYTLFATISTIQYVNSVVASGMYVTITASDIVSAFVGQVGPYVFYTLALFGLGVLIDFCSVQFTLPQTDETPSVKEDETADETKEETTETTETTESADTVEPESTVTLIVEESDEISDQEIKAFEEELVNGIDSVQTEEVVIVEIPEEE